MLGETTVEVNGLCLNPSQTYVLMIEQRDVSRIIKIPSYEYTRKHAKKIRRSICLDLSNQISDSPLRDSQPLHRPVHATEGIH